MFVKVIAQVEEITKDKKVYTFKMRRRKNSKRLRGFRRSIVIARINEINLGNALSETTNFF
jgi:large subunit ribosomal protein L21